MAVYCPVAPAHILKELIPFREPDYRILLLTHEVLKNPKEHRAAMAASATVILDNSVVELGTAASLQDVKAAVRALEPSTHPHLRRLVIALPDVYLDAKKTVESIGDNYPSWGEKLLYEKSVEFMIIPQGQNLHEFTWCAETLLKIAPAATWIGVPRNLVRNLGTRRDAIAVCRALSPHKSIHMLGCSDDIIDDVLCARMYEVDSIDSSVPFRAALSGHELQMSSMRSHDREWWDKIQFNPLCVANFDKFRQWVRRIR